MMHRKQIRDFFLPLSGNVSFKEKILSGLAALTGIALVAWISQWTTGVEGLVFVAVSMGSAAVLLFATPHSPMAQPWPLIGGHLVSALVGVLCYQWVSSVSLAAALAVAMAIVAMFFLRCMNPPGGAAALGAVLGGPAIHDLGFYYVLVPVGLNVMVIFMVALVVNNLIPGRRYPLMPETAAEQQQLDHSWALGQNLINDKDLDSAMDNLDSYIDADREDLKQIYQQATMNAYKRRLGHVSCADIMTPNPTVITADMLMGQARQIMTEQNRRALPVIDEHHHVIGLLTQEELLRETRQTVPVAEVMRAEPDTVLAEQHVLDIVPLISQKGWRRVSVVNDNKELLGIITRSDIIRALLSLR